MSLFVRPAGRGTGAGARSPCTPLPRRVAFPLFALIHPICFGSLLFFEDVMPATVPPLEMQKLQKTLVAPRAASYSHERDSHGEQVNGLQPALLPTGIARPPGWELLLTALDECMETLLCEEDSAAAARCVVSVLPHVLSGAQSILDKLEKGQHCSVQAGSPSTKHAAHVCTPPETQETVVAPSHKLTKRGKLPKSTKSRADTLSSLLDALTKLRPDPNVPEPVGAIDEPMPEYGDSIRPRVSTASAQPLTAKPVVIALSKRPHLRSSSAWVSGGETSGGSTTSGSNRSSPRDRSLPYSLSHVALEKHAKNEQLRTQMNETRYPDIIPVFRSPAASSPAVIERSHSFRGVLHGRRATELPPPRASSPLRSRTLELSAFRTAAALRSISELSDSSGSRAGKLSAASVKEVAPNLHVRPMNSAASEPKLLSDMPLPFKLSGSLASAPAGTYGLSNTKVVRGVARGTSKFQAHAEH